MSVTPDDVRHVAALARLGLDPARVPALVAELNGILAHMDVLSRVDTRSVGPAAGIGAGGTPLRADDGGVSTPLAVPLDAFAPETRDGLLLVPRLASHAASHAASGAAPDATGAGPDDEVDA